MAGLSPKAAWERMILRGQERAVRDYGHLSADELRELGAAGKIQRHVVEYLIVLVAEAKRE